MSQNTSYETRIRQEQSAKELAQKLVESAKKLGVDQADATVGFGSSLSIKAREGDIEESKISSSNSAAIRIIHNGRLGFATSAAAPQSQSEIEHLCKRALELSEIAAIKEENIIPKSASFSETEINESAARLKLWHESTAEMSKEWAVKRALELDRQLSQVKGLASVSDASASIGLSAFALANHHGFSGAFSESWAQLYAGAVAEDTGNKKQVGGWWEINRDIQKLPDAEFIVKMAAQRTLEKLGGQKIKSAKLPVILTPEMTRTFFSAILSAINGSSLSQDSSFLKEKLGQKVFIPGYSLIDQPLVVGGLGSTPFDGEGQKVEDTLLIDSSGILKNIFVDARSAHKLNQPLKAHAGRGASSMPYPSSTNTYLKGGAGTLEDIISRTDKGLVITNMMGHSPDPVTGEYSRGASGFWVENGEKKFPVEEFTIAGDMQEMMQNIDFVGDDFDQRSSLQVPTIRFKELSISGL